MKTWNPRKQCLEDRKDIEPFIEEYKQLCRKHNMQIDSYAALDIMPIDEPRLEFDGVTVYFEERK